eukprot:m.359851 g.359851  ORF g.359851 m.359851 type:complete len:784 (-) comp18772_c0_seq1:497-2848(-)
MSDSDAQPAVAEAESEAISSAAETAEPITEGQMESVAAPDDGTRQAQITSAFETSMQDLFESADPDGNGILQYQDFYAIFSTPEYGFNFTEEEIHSLYQHTDADADGQITYKELSVAAKPHILEILQQQQHGSDWVEIYSREHGVVYLNKMTGESQQHAPDGLTASEDDIVADAIVTHFTLRDPEATGLVDFNTFCLDLQAQELGLFLSVEEVTALVEVHPPDDQQMVNYYNLSPTVRNYVMQLYQGRDPHPGHWCRLKTSQFGVFWFNKLSGAMQQEVPDDVILGVQAAPGGFTPTVVEGTSVADAERAEAYRKQVEELQGQLAAGSGTGGAGGLKVDELEAKLKEKELELTKIKEELEQVKRSEGALKSSQTQEQGQISEVIQARDDALAKIQSLQSERDKALIESKDSKARTTALEEQISELETAFEASRAQCQKLESNLSKQKKSASALQSEVDKQDTLVAEIDELKEQLRDTRALLEEKTRNLASARSQIKQAREQMKKAKEEAAQANDLRLQLHDGREQLQTTKAFLSSKSKLLATKTDEIKRLEQKMAALLEQDERRSKILEDLLARHSSLQFQVSGPDPALGLESTRPLSASPLPQDRDGDSLYITNVPATRGRKPSPQRQQPSPQQQYQYQATQQATTRRKSSTSLLPPLHQQRQSQVDVPTEEDDIAACHIRVGDRVLIRGERVDGITKQYTAQVKYLGRLDNEYIDYNIYAGVKMDDKIGDTDGLYKGKRYFKCTQEHGRFVPLSDIISVVASRAPKRRTQTQSQTRREAFP